MNAHCSIQLHWVLGKHENAARLLVPTTVLSPFPPLSGWRKCVAYATSISVIHPSLCGWRLFISTLSGWRWFISTLSGWRWFISTLSGRRWFISTLQGWCIFISTLLGWRICLAYATPGSSQGYTGISVYMAMASPHVSNTPMNRCPSGLHASFRSVPQLTPITVSCQSERLTNSKSSNFVAAITTWTALHAQLGLLLGRLRKANRAMLAIGWRTSLACEVLSDGNHAVYQSVWILQRHFGKTQSQIWSWKM